MDTEIPNEIKIQIIRQEIAMYKNTCYQLEMRHRVNKKLGNTLEQLKGIEEELTKANIALDEYREIEKEIEAQIKEKK